MKALLHLVLTLLILLGIILAAYLALPALLTEIARHQLQALGFTEISITRARVNLQGTSIDSLKIENEQHQIDLRGLHVSYEPAELLSGRLKILTVDRITVTETPGEPTGFSLPEPATIAGLLGSDWPLLLPLDALGLTSLALLDADKQRVVSGSAGITLQEQTLAGTISLRDSDHTPYEITLEHSPDTGLTVQLDSSQPETLLTKLRTRPDSQGVSGTLDLGLATLSHLLSLPMSIDGHIQARFSISSVPGTPSYDFSLGLNGAGLKAIDWHIDQLNTDLKASFIEEPEAYVIEFVETSQLALFSLSQGTDSLESLRFELPQSLKIDKTDHTIRVDGDALLLGKNLKTDSIEIPEVKIEHISVQFSPQGETPERCEFDAQLSLSRIDLSDLQLQPSPIKLLGTCPGPDEPKWALNATLDTLAFEDPTFQGSLTNCRIQLGNQRAGELIDNNPAELAGSLLCDVEPPSGQLDTQFRFNPMTSTGRAEFTIADLKPNNDQPLFDSLLKDWDQEFDIVAGTLSALGTYRWWQNSKGQDRERLGLELALKEAGGRYAGVLFSGLNYQDSIDLLPQLDSAGFSELSVQNIDIGVPISNASARVRFHDTASGPLPLISIDELRLPLLDGAVTANELSMDLNQAEQQLLLKVENLELPSIVALQQLEELSATGKLSGVVPVRFGPGGVTISAGSISAQTPGGRIQYLPSGSAQQAGESVGGTELVLKVLEDLNYDSLEAKVDYAENGELNMQLAIKGKSPQVDNNRPIHFNLNLQQNLLTLLKGLRYTDGINEDIDKNVQKYFSEQQQSAN